MGAASNSGDGVISWWNLGKRNGRRTKLCFYFYHGHKPIVYTLCISIGMAFKMIETPLYMKEQWNSLEVSFINIMRRYKASSGNLRSCLLNNRTLRELTRTSTLVKRKCSIAKIHYMIRDTRCQIMLHYKGNNYHDLNYTVICDF